MNKFILMICMSCVSIIGTSCKKSKNSNSDNKPKVQQPAPPFSQPLPELPHRDPEHESPDTDGRGPLAGKPRENIIVSRKICLKVIAGKYKKSNFCHDFNPNRPYQAFRWCQGYHTVGAPDAYEGAECRGGFPYFVQYHFGIRKIYFASLLNYQTFTARY